jgi:glycosyltransferase involved in cell wall biosynthesis
MLIAVNTRLLIPDRLDGIGWFTCETLKRITTAHPEHQFLFLFDRQIPDQFVFSANIEPISLYPPARHPVLWHWWMEYSVRKILRSRDPDLFLSPDGFLCLSADTPSLPVIHDINFHHRPADLPFFPRWYYRKQFPSFARKAVRIATVSEYSKQDIAQSYDIDVRKIDVVYNGVNPIFRPVSEEDRQKTRSQLTGGEDYFLYIGMLHPRKNLINLLFAFDEFKNASPTGIKLVIAGDYLFRNNMLQNTYKKMNHREDVKFVGRQSPEQLHLLLGSAFSLTFVSFFEGFGIPILEAMQCDVPVITSGTTSMPEVSGDAALLVNPHSVESIKDGLLQITGDLKFRTELIRKGRIQREKFSWEITSEKLWDSMIACLQ